MAEPPHSPETLLELIRQLTRGVLGLLVECAQASGLNQTDYLALVRLVAADGLSPVELRPILGLRGSSIVEVADRLERRRLITRSRSLEDRRRVVLRPTARGRGMVERTLGPALANIGASVAALSTNDVVAVGRFLSQLAIGLSETAPRTPPGHRAKRPPEHRA
jgi:DNA-binding MarR family transcriptional regulator